MASFQEPLSIRPLFEQALKENILLNPGNMYDRNDHQHLRLSYAYASYDQLERTYPACGAYPPPCVVMKKGIPRTLIHREGPCLMSVCLLHIANLYLSPTHDAVPSD